MIFKKGDNVIITNNNSEYNKIYIVEEDYLNGNIKLKDYEGLFNASHFTLVKENIPERKYLVFDTDIKDNFKTKEEALSFGKGAYSSNFVIVKISDVEEYSKEWERV